MILFAGDHEGGEVGGVDGEEHHGKQRPDARHESRRDRQSWAKLLLKALMC